MTLLGKLLSLADDRLPLGACTGVSHRFGSMPCSALQARSVSGDSPGGRGRRVDSTFPNCFGRSLQSHGLQHKSFLVRHMTLQTMHIMFSRFRRLVEASGPCPTSGCG